ncbi:MAG: hypothetical protein RSD23_08075 [Ruthenibacterium sp.]
MAALLKGIDVILYDKVQSGADAFHHAIYTETPVTVQNVLVCALDADDMIQQTQLSGKRVAYELCIPKGDSHIWEDRKVAFWGETWHTVGFGRRWIDANVPLDWNEKIKVERYG